MKLAQETADGRHRNGQRKRTRGFDGMDDESSDEENEPKRPRVAPRQIFEGAKLEGMSE